MYCPPSLSRAGHGLYALIGHHPKPGRAPIPPPIRPSPPQPRGAAERATPQRAQVFADGEEEEEEVERSCGFVFLFFCCFGGESARHESEEEQGDKKRETGEQIGESGF